MRCWSELHTPSGPCFFLRGEGKEVREGEVRWFGEEKSKPKRDETTGWQENCQVDWTGLDKIGPGPNQGEGDENEQSGGGIERDVKDQTSQIPGDRRTRRRESTPHSQLASTHTHTHTHHTHARQPPGAEKMIDQYFGESCCAMLRCPAALVGVLCSVVSPCKRRASPLSSL